MNEAAQHPRRWRRRGIFLGAGASIALVLGIAWADRRQFAAHFVDRELAAAGVHGNYRITALGPFQQVIEDVRLGDPAHPDFTGRRVELQWRYRFGLPSLAAVHVEGARIKAQWRDGRLSFGAIDRLLPTSSGGGPALPDMRVALNDVRIALSTPAGTATVSVEGSGNPARDFIGLIRADAPSLTAAGCHARRISARIAVRSSDRSPHLQGPVAVGGAVCPARSLILNTGKAALDLGLAPALDKVDGTVTLAGFGGRYRETTFGPLHGTMSMTGGKTMAGTASLGITKVTTPQGSAQSASLAGDYRIDAQWARFTGRVALRGVRAAPQLSATIRTATAATSATPIAPIAAQLRDRLTSILAGADVDAPLTLVAGARRSLRIDRAIIRSPDAATATLSAAYVDEGEGWTIEGHLAGKALPRIDGRAAQAGKAASVEAVLQMAPYRTGSASLALTPLHITSANGRTHFNTTATIDGPIGDGSIAGLVMPIAGSIRANGALEIGNGCNPIRFRRVAISGMALDPGRVTLCGAPIVARTGSGALRIAAEARNIVLRGRSGAAPLTLQAGMLRLSTTGFAADRAVATIGAGDDPTRLSIGAMEGSIHAGSLSGHFTDAAGVIGAVPLALSGASGDWRFGHGELHLTGALQLADRAPSPRFLPMASHDVTLTLADGRIDAEGSLQVPAHDATIAHVTLHHQLSSGTGGAIIAVPGIPFQPKGLQPEMLTPLTLGVIANLSGIVRGQGRIDWAPSGVTSSGTFDTDRLDLAAAFGPVTGLSGTIRFTDLLGLVSAPSQEAHIAAINPGVEVTDGVVHYHLPGGNRIVVEDARWPFAGGALTLDPATLDFSQASERRLTFQISALDAAAFIQQLDFPNIAATGTFDGRLPMVFDQTGGRIENGMLKARGPGTLAYVGELSNADLGNMGKLAFDALKAIRYSGLDISLGGNLDGEIVTRVRFEGVHQATGDRGLVARMIHNLPFRFNIQIRAPFRGLVGSARSYMNPALLLQAGHSPAAVQPADSAPVR